MVKPDRKQVFAEDEIFFGEYESLNWRFQDSQSQKTFKFQDFSEAFAFMTKVAAIAEELDHHPDWFNSWDTVEITVTNHEAGGITEIDLYLCKRINETAKNEQIRN